MRSNSPRILILDIETAPIIAHVWGLWENNVGLNQVVSDWHLLSWSAKWLNDPHNKIMYKDQRDVKDISDDNALLLGIWALLDEADIIITQNGKAFDVKKLNARFLMNGYVPPSSYRHLDTKQMASRHFGFTSNKLEYLTDKLCVKYKKIKHTQFPGHELWTECLKGNMKAWKVMEKYNKHDVLSLEELFLKLRPWASDMTLSTYYPEADPECDCGCQVFTKNGYYYTTTGKFQKHRCSECGSEYRDSTNLLSKEDRGRIRRRVL